MTKSLWQKFTIKPSALEAFQSKEMAESSLILTDLLAAREDDEDHIVMQLTEGHVSVKLLNNPLLFLFETCDSCYLQNPHVINLLSPETIKRKQGQPVFIHKPGASLSFCFFATLMTCFAVCGGKKNTSKAINRSCTSQKEHQDSHKTVHHHCTLFSLNCVLLNKILFYWCFVPIRLPLTFHSPALNATLPAAPESSSGSLRMLRASSTRCGADSDAKTIISRFSTEMEGPEYAATCMSVSFPQQRIKLPRWGGGGWLEEEKGWGAGVDAALSIAGSL